LAEMGMPNSALTIDNAPHPSKGGAEKAEGHNSPLGGLGASSHRHRIFMRM
jgi:hypothetical protein